MKEDPEAVRKWCDAQLGKPMLADAVVWRPFTMSSALGGEWYRATEWLDGIGIRCVEKPDAMAEGRTDVYLFRLDGCESTTDPRVVRVFVDHNPDGNEGGERDRSQVVRVEVTRG